MFITRIGGKASAKKRLLPEDAYPPGIGSSAKDYVDENLRSQLHTIPVEPGEYFDNENELWTLSEKGEWTDHVGDSRSKRYTPIMSAFGPFTKKLTD